MIMKKVIVAVSLLFSLGNADTLVNVKEDVEVPYIPFNIKMGKYFDVVQANCLTCHSFGYVLNQGKQSKLFWEEKVQKMIKAFKAPITEQDQKFVVAYLFEHYGNGKEK